MRALMRKISLNSRRKLQPTDARHFTNLGPKLFVDLAMVVCSSGVLPQKELHECWQMADRVHTEFPDVSRVVDIAAGHGLLAWILVLLARQSEAPILRTAVALDVSRPKSANVLALAITSRWPDLVDSVHYVECGADVVTADEGDDETLFVAAHACGSLSDQVLLAAIASNNPVAIMPCCHSLRNQAETLSALGSVSGMGPGSTANVDKHPSAIDQFRIDALLALGYDVRQSSIEAEISACNQIIMGSPPRASRRFADLPVRQDSSTESIKSQRGRGMRAYESVRSLNVNDHGVVKNLSLRPSREWWRSFDLSFWVHDDFVGHRNVELLSALVDRLLVRNDLTKIVSIRDRYTEPSTQRRSFTYQIKLESTSAEISKKIVADLRVKLCRGMRLLSYFSKNDTELRS